MGSSSPLLRAAAIGRLSDAEAALVAPAMEAILLQHGQHLGEEATATACEALVLAGLHHAAQARHRALATACRLVAAEPRLAIALVAAIRCWQRQPFSGPAYIDPSDDSGVSRVRLLACCPITGSASMNFLPRGFGSISGRVPCSFRLYLGDLVHDVSKHYILF